MEGIGDWEMSATHEAAICGLSQVAMTTILPIVWEINKSARDVFSRINRRLCSIIEKA